MLQRVVLSGMPKKTGWIAVPHRALLSSQEATWAGTFLRELAAQFASLGITPTPLLRLRIEDVVMTALAAQRLEAAGLAHQPEKTSKARDPWEAAGKARERQRRAMSDLEESCEKLGARIDLSLPERAQPLLEAGRGVAEASLRPLRNKEIRPSNNNI